MLDWLLQIDQQILQLTQAKKDCFDFYDSIGAALSLKEGLAEITLQLHRLE